MSETLPANNDNHLRVIEALYSGHHGWLYATLKKKLGNAMDAADLAQDTFTRILASQVTTIEQPRAYLSCVAKGILINWYQRKALERAYLDALAHLPAPEVPSPSCASWCWKPCTKSTRCSTPCRRWSNVRSCCRRSAA
jgi:RNA polymerase sigma-70 factor (ECF subfamily)